MVLTPKSRRLIRRALEDLNEAEEKFNEAFRQDVAKILGASAKTLDYIARKIERAKRSLEKLEASG